MQVAAYLGMRFAIPTAARMKIYDRRNESLLTLQLLSHLRELIAASREWLTRISQLSRVESKRGESVSHTFLGLGRKTRLICIPLPSLFPASPCVRVRVIVRPSGRGRPFLPFSLSFHPISLADAFPHGARAVFELHIVRGKAETGGIATVLSKDFDAIYVLFLEGFPRWRRGTPWLGSPLLCLRCAWRARCRSSSHHPPLLSLSRWAPGANLWKEG